MKKSILITAILTLCGIVSNAQTVADGLSFNSSITQGTARFRALSGAFGALGSDLSATGINPASSTIFANHYVSFSLDTSHLDNEANYFGTTATNSDSDFSINQAGIALVFESADSPVNKFSIGFNYDSNRNYDNQLLIRGVSDTSVSNYFLNNANGFELRNFQTLNNESVSDLYQFLGEEPGLGFAAQQGLLGFQSFLIDPLDPANANNVDYISNTGTGTFNQQQLLTTQGYQGKFTFNGAFELNKRFSFGLNVNTHIVDKERRTEFRENNSNANATVTDVRFENFLTTEASGISLQLGTLIKITNSLRAGLSYESPTWFTVDETLTQSISSNRLTGTGTINEIVAPNVINIYAPYNLRTPGGFSGSLAYIFGDAGLLSVDVSSKDHRNLRFSDVNGDPFVNNNTFADDNLQTALTYRVGGELKIKNLFVRGGAVHSQSPYVDENIVGDLNGFSLGLGYRWGSTVLDVAYNRSQQEFSQQLFDTGLTSAAMVDQTLTNVVVTLSFNL